MTHPLSLPNNMSRSGESGFVSSFGVWPRISQPSRLQRGIGQAGAQGLNGSDED